MGKIIKFNKKNSSKKSGNLNISEFEKYYEFIINLDKPNSLDMFCKKFCRDIFKENFIKKYLILLKFRKLVKVLYITAMLLYVLLLIMLIPKELIIDKSYFSITIIFVSAFLIPVAFFQRTFKNLLEISEKYDFEPIKRRVEKVRLFKQQGSIRIKLYSFERIII